MKALLFAAALALVAGDGEKTEAERLADHPWAIWTDGSWVRYQVDNEVTGKMTSTASLVGLSADAYRLEDVTQRDEEENVKRIDHGYALLGYPHAQRGAQRVGEEAVKVGNKTYQCEVWKARWTENEEPFEAVAWVADGVRHPLRVKQKTSNLTIDLKVAVLEDWIKIAGHKFRCARYEGTTSYQGRRSPVTQWRTFDIPGGVARTVSRVQTPEGTVEHVNEVIEFRGTPRRR